MGSEVAPDFEAMTCQENDKKLSLGDLPDDILKKICNFRQLRPGLKLRLNKRLEQRIHSLFETIDFSVSFVLKVFRCRVLLTSYLIVLHRTNLELA